MPTVTDNIEALAAGRAVDELTAMVWTLHGGLTAGSTTLIVRSDRVVIEAVMPPNGADVPPRTLGEAAPQTLQTLAQALLDNRFDSIASAPPSRPGLPQVELTVVAGESRVNCMIPTPQLDSVPAMRAIGAAFDTVRKSF